MRKKPMSEREEIYTMLAIVAFVALCIVIALVGLTRNARADEPSTTLRALQAMPRHESDADELDIDRAERLSYIAGAIDGVARDRLERAVLLVIIRGESGLARFVDLDWDVCREGHGGRCDSGRAYGMAQLHGMLRTETRAEQMQRAIKLWRYHRQRCGSVAGAFAGYGSGNSCKLTRQSIERAESAKKLAGRL